MKLKALALAPLGGFLLAWFFLLRPVSLGGPASYVLVRGVSMQPALHDGDLVVTREQDSYHRGDVVAFRIPEGEPGEGALVIHRIVGGSSNRGFVMQGDNKDVPDMWRPTEEDIIGSRWLRLPAAGRLISRVPGDRALASSLAAGLAVFLVLAGGGSGRKNRDRFSGPTASGAAAPGRRRGDAWTLAELCEDIDHRLESLERRTQAHALEDAGNTSWPSPDPAPPPAREPVRWPSPIVARHPIRTEEGP